MPERTAAATTTAQPKGLRDVATLRLCFLAIVLFWTMIMAASYLWYIRSGNQEILELATVEARASFNKDLVYRRWAARHGGVYVPVTADTPPSPYLAHVQERDIFTPSGRALTLLNPAYMTRQAHELGREQYGTQGHITSLKPLRPENAPDPWEREVLLRFEQGETEVTAVLMLGGEPHLRFMRALRTEKSCLKCHADQGYREGDVRGGISVSTPMAPYYAISARRFAAITFVHLCLWFLGLLGSGFAYSRLRHQFVLRAETEEILRGRTVELGERVNELRCLFSVSKLFERDDLSLEEKLRQILLVAPAGWRYPEEVCLRIRLGGEEFVPENFQESPWRLAREITVQGRVAGEMEVFYRREMPAADEGPFLREEKELLAAIVERLQDVLERLAAEEKNREIAGKLRQAQKMEAIGTLAGGIAHDFNNILSIIFGYGELARLNMDKPDELRNDLDEVRRGAERARDLVGQILAFSRKSEQEKRPLQISSLIKEALRMLRATIPATIEIRQEIKSDGAVLADPTGINQILMNLCTNAYQAMQDTGGILAVSLEETEIGQDDYGYADVPAGRYLKLAVSDTGCGIAPEFLDKIFEPYFTTKGPGSGTGLGLAVVHGIVKSHNGHITVYSEPGRGTSFHVYLPLAEAVPETARHKEEIAPVAGNGEWILFVDDEEKIGDASRDILQRHGYRVATCASGAQALEEFRSQPERFALVITDLTMPKMDGVDLAGRILAIRPGIPVILCTGQSGIIHREQALALGVSAYIYKPLTGSQLLAAVATALQEKGPSGA